MGGDEAWTPPPENPPILQKLLKVVMSLKDTPGKSDHILTTPVGAPRKGASLTLAGPGPQKAGAGGSSAWYIYL